MTAPVDWSDTPGNPGNTVSAAKLNLRDNLINGKGTYSKPGSGIPASDMTAAVQASLVKADASGTYTKPGTGIPSTDMSAAVQASLAKADSAVLSGSTGTVTGTMIASNTIPVGDLNATGTRDSTTCLHGDNVFRVPAGGGGAVDAEGVRDVMATAMVGTAPITVTPNDALDTITVALSDAELSALASTTSAADKVPFFTGAGTASTLTCTAAARALLDDVDATAMRATLGVPTLIGATTIEVVSTLPGTPNVDTVYILDDAGAPRVLPITSSLAPIVNTDKYDAVSITAQAGDFTSMSTNLTGTWKDFQELKYRIKDNGSPRVIPWGAFFADGNAALPTVTIPNRTLSVRFEFDIADGRFMCQETASRSSGTGTPPSFGTLGAILSGASAQTTANLPVPASVAAGDVILATFFVDPFSVTMTPPAGFTEAPDSPINITTGQAVGIRVYWKRQTSATGAGETSGTYPFTMTTGFRGGRALRFTGCIASGNPFDVTNSAVKTSTADGTTPVVSISTTSGPNRLLVHTCIGFNGGGAPAPAGYTEQFDDGGQTLSTKTQVSTGGSGSVTTTFGSNGASAAWLGALLPA